MEDDVELSSVVTLIVVNGLLLTLIAVVALVYHKWDRKITYADNLSDNEIGQRLHGNGNPLIFNGLIAGDGAEGVDLGGLNRNSQLESLISRDLESNLLVAAAANIQPSAANNFTPYQRERNKIALDLTSIGSRQNAFPTPQGYSRQNSLLSSSGAGGSFYGLYRTRSNAHSGVSGNLQGHNQIEDEDDLMTPLNHPEVQIEELLTRPRSWRQLFLTLWYTDEYRLLKLQNPDGFFYLLYLKRCFQLFSVLSLWNLFVLLPSYTVLNDSRFSYILPSELQKSSTLDYFTLADSLLSPQVIWLALMLTLLYSTLAYYAVIVQFSQKMSSFEFPPTHQYLDDFISQHTIMIRGVNPEIGVEEANCMIKKLFEERFGPKQIVAVHAIRRTENVQELFHKKTIYKQKVEQYRMQNNFQDGKREHLWVGSRWRCNRRRVDSEEYYKAKLSKVEADWEFLKVRQYRENAGIAFVSFRDKNCVIDAIDEIEIYKVKLQEKDYYEKLKFANWEVDEAMPVSDIIWSELNKSSSSNVIAKFLLTFLLPLGFSACAVFGIVYVDADLMNLGLFASLTLKYLCPIILSSISFYLVPKLLFNVVLKSEHLERKSLKEEKCISKNIKFMFLTSLILPISAFALYFVSKYDYGQETMNENIRKLPDKVPNQGGDPLLTLYSTRVDNRFNEFVAITISSSQEFFTRYALHMVLIITLSQVFLSPDKLNKIFQQTSLSGSKTKFKHWVYDLGFKGSIAVSFFTFSLFFSIIIPMILPISAFAFLLAYYIDKYNMIYVYPLDFDSKPTTRRALIIFSVVGIILFQMVMFLISSTVLSKRVAIYLFAFLVIQIMVIVTAFEFMRKPWEGRELQLEKAVQQQATNLFESISSLHHTIDHFGGGSSGNIPEISRFESSGARPNESISNNNRVDNQLLNQTHIQKINILTHAYQNPYEQYFTNERGAGIGNRDNYQDGVEVDEALFSRRSSKQLRNQTEESPELNRFSQDENDSFLAGQSSRRQSQSSLKAQINTIND